MAAARHDEVNVRSHVPRMLGRRYGSWKVIAATGKSGRTNRYRVRCVVCGRERDRLSTHLRSLRACCEDASAEPYFALPHGVVVDRFTPWAHDDRCWYVVACHPDGLPLEQIGQLMGMSRERVRQIEDSALRKLREACQAEGVQLREIWEWLCRRNDENGPWD